jgi:DUF4097 and DUF4098 domain-containing protein YvlB
MNKIIKIIILSLLAIALTIFMIFAINNKNIHYINLINYSSELILDKEFNSTDVKSFDITSDSSDITIKKADISNISVKVYGDKRNEVITSTKDNILYIDNSNDYNICLFFCMMNSRIEILVPELEYNNLKIEVASGDINIEDITLNNVDINSKSGNVRLNKSTTADIDVVSGDVNVEELDSGKLITVSGNIIVNNINEVNARTISGDIKITNIGKTCQLSTTSGNIWISNLNMLTDSSLKTISGDVRVLKANDIYFDISTISGTVYAEKNNRFSEKEIKISTTSGNVYIAQ